MTNPQENLINSIGRSVVWANDAIKQINVGVMQDNARRDEWRRLLYLAAETLAEIKNEIQDGSK